MKRIKTKTIAITVFLGLLLAFPLLSTVSATFVDNLKVNGKISGIVYVVGTDVSFPDTLMLQTLSNLNSLTGSGSLHGIACGATMFFDYKVTLVGDYWTMTGTIVGTNMGHQGAYGWLLGLTITLTITSADLMTFAITDEFNNLYFSGSGTPIINAL